MSETVDTLQDLIFVLEHSLRQPEWYLWKMPFWIAKKRLSQIQEYNKQQEEEMKKNEKNTKNAPRAKVK